MDKSSFERSHSLDEFLEQSDFVQAYIIVHKGNIVYEKYPRLRQVPWRQYVPGDAKGLDLTSRPNCVFVSI